MKKPYDRTIFFQGCEGTGQVWIRPPSELVYSTNTWTMFEIPSRRPGQIQPYSQAHWPGSNGEAQTLCNPLAIAATTLAQHPANPPTANLRVLCFFLHPPPTASDEGHPAACRPRLGRRPARRLLRRRHPRPACRGLRTCRTVRRHPVPAAERGLLSQCGIIGCIPWAFQRDRREGAHMLDRAADG